MAEQYTTRPSPPTTEERTGWTAMDATGSAYIHEINAPLDRVRWASVLAGVFTVFTTLAVMAVLGIAIGLSTFEADQPQNFGIGAGIYGAVSALVAFALGGFLSARTAAVAGRGNGVLNGIMVWVVTIPLIVNLLGSGIGTILGTATSLVGTAAEVAAPAIGAVVDDAVDSGVPAGAAATPAGAVDATVPAGAEGQATVPAGEGGIQATAVTGAQEAVQDIQSQVQNVTPQQVEDVARDASGAAWATLLALGLSALAAAVGGLIGTRSFPTPIAVRETRAPTRNMAR